MKFDLVAWQGGQEMFRERFDVPDDICTEQGKVDWITAKLGVDWHDREKRTAPESGLDKLRRME